MEKEMGNANDRRAPVKGVSATLASPHYLRWSIRHWPSSPFPVVHAQRQLRKRIPRSLIALSYFGNSFVEQISIRFLVFISKKNLPAASA
jgi:hypothetical protein